MKTIVIVKGDTNDADYVHQITEITDAEQIALVRRVAEAIREQTAKLKRNHHNWDVSEYGNENDHPRLMYSDVLEADDIDAFDETFVPIGENGMGVHSIDEIRLLHVSFDVDLLK